LGYKKRKCIGKTVNHHGVFQYIVESFTDAVTEAQHQHKVVVSIRKNTGYMVFQKNLREDPTLLSKIAAYCGVSISLFLGMSSKVTDENTSELKIYLHKKALLFLVLNHIL
jgi:hypothetical protein